MLRFLRVLTPALLAVTPVAGQDVAVVSRNLNLRTGPSVSATVIATVREGEIIAILKHGHRSGFYRVRTQEEETGWVTDRYVHILDPTEVHQPSPAGVSPDSLSDLSVAAGDFDGCPIEGNAIPQNVKDLNRFKNRSAEPRAEDVDPGVTIGAMLAPSDDDSQRFDDAKAAEVIAFVYRVIPGGRSETTNCRKTDAVHRDTHIELTLTPADTQETRRVIVEVTPRWRAAAKDRGLDWSTATLQRTLEGHWARVRGWLFFDAEHKGQAENTHPGGESNWRATVWEIHPVTSLTIVSQP